MGNLATEFLGIRSPNPFWLASAPPTDKEYNVVRAFEMGWGGVVWKTVGEDPPVVNVNGPRYGTLLSNARHVLGFNNIELISDRPLQSNLDEMARVKRAWPDRALIASLMTSYSEDAWRDLVRKVEDTGCDGLELNFGCPQGMSERGMGAAIGQVPESVETVVGWCKKHAQLPVIVKLTPNITDIRHSGRAARKGGADAVSLINTINSLIGVDIENMSIFPNVGGRGTHGGYCGPAVKPIALHMVAEIARDPEMSRMPISGMGGVTTWRDAAEFIALGCGTVQVCTAAMVYGFKIINDLCDGLSNFMDTHGYASLQDMMGRAVPSIADWNDLDLNCVEKAVINQDLCIECGRCHIACEDASHQAITSTKNGKRHFEINEVECVGCNLCVSICPVPDCITMRRLAPGEVDVRTGHVVSAQYANWTTHPNNPAASGSN